MIDQLQEIDISVLDELIEIKQQRTVLEERLEKLDEEQGNVSDDVFARVRQDYTGKREGLIERATPLKDQARREHLRLQELLEKTRQLLSEARADDEELQLRHRLGEFDADELADRRSSVEARLKRHDAELDALSDIRERFVAAFDSEDELLRPVGQATIPPPEGGEAAPPDEGTVMLPRDQMEPSAAADESAVEEPAVEEPAEASEADEPEAAEEPPAEEEKAAEEDIAEEPTAAEEESTAAEEEPVAEELVAEELVAEEPPEESAAEEEEPAAKEPAAEEPAAEAESEEAESEPEVADEPPPEVPPIPSLSLEADATEARLPEDLAAQAGSAPETVNARPIGSGEVQPPADAVPRSEVQAGGPPGATVILPTSQPEIPPVPTPASMDDGATAVMQLASLIAAEPLPGGQDVYAVEPLTTLGRSPQNKIQILEPSVSRQHAEIHLRPGGYVLKDLGSENGTFVNGDPIQGEVPIADNDRVQFGTIRFIFQTSPPPV